MVNNLYFVFAFFLGFVLDQFSKFIVIKYNFIPYFYNEGIAFSIQLPSPWQTIVIISALIFIFSILYREARRTNSRILFVSSGLVFAGALGNLTDRLFYQGKVIDFIAVPYFSVFNIADVCITLGIGLYLYYSVFPLFKKAEGYYE